MNAARSDRYLDRLRAGTRVPKVIRLMQSLSERDELVLDLGANIGGISLPLGQSGRRVVAVEAQAENYALLCHGIAANQLAGRVSALHAAVGAAVGTTEIAGTSAFAHVPAGGGAGGNTPVLPLDLIGSVMQAQSATAIKLDVEGSELAVLSGARETLARPTLRHIVTEGNGAHSHRMGHRPADLLEILEGAGFRCYLLRGRRLVERTSADFQFLGNADYLATRAEQLPDRFEHGELSEEDIVEGVVRTLTDMSEPYRRFMLDELRYADEGILSTEPVRRRLAELADDGVTAADALVT